MNKRYFLARSGQTLLGGALAAKAWGPALAGPMPQGRPASDAATPSALQGLGHWQALIGTVFATTTPVRLSTNLTLTEVRPCHAAPGLEQFTLVFQGPSHRQLPAGLHALAPGGQGHQPVYLDPVAHQGGLTTYTASFSLIAQA